MKKMSLQVKLLVLICSILLPINLLLLAFIGSSVQSVRGRLKESYQNDMNVMKVQVKSQLESIDSELITSSSEQWTSLMRITEKNTLEQQDLVEHLKIIWQRHDLLQGGYLRMKEGELPCITYNSGYLTIAQKEDLAQTLQNSPLDFSYKQQSICTLAGEYYWVWNVNEGSYSWGVFIPISRIMEIFKTISSEIGELYITDKQGMIMMASNDSTGKILGEKNQEIYKLGWNGIDAVLVRIIPSEIFQARLPLGTRILRNFAVLAGCIIPILWLAIRKLVINPMRRLRDAMEEIERDNVEYRIAQENAGTKDFQYLFSTFNHMVGQIQKLRIQKYEIEIEKLQVETVNLRLQVNPHLLLNSLNMICSLAKLGEYQTIQNYAMNLAEYFRYALRKSDELVPLEAEMRFVKCYLDIQKIRFPGAFTSVYDIEEDLQTLLIPPLLIQNFVENSCKYALRLDSVIEIIVIVRREGDKTIIAVIDTGSGMDEDTLKSLKKGDIIENKTGRHIGIWNIRKRLHLYYGEDVEMNINSEPDAGTQVWVKIPGEKSEGKC